MILKWDTVRFFEETWFVSPPTPYSYISNLKLTVVKADILDPQQLRVTEKCRRGRDVIAVGDRDPASRSKALGDPRPAAAAALQARLLQLKATAT